MKIKDLTKQELEALSYTDITAMILEENKKPMTTPAIFHKICDLLGYSEEVYVSKVGDYYTSLTTDRRFILLDTAEWDLRDHHIVKVEVEDEDEEVADVEEEEEEIIEEEEDIDAVIEEDLDDVESELEDLSIVADEEELEEN